VSPHTREIARACEEAVRAHLAQPSEATLLGGYEIGRRAMFAGIGVVELAATAGTVLVEALRSRGSAGGTLDDVAAANALMVEMLSPFEMSHRGAHEANAALRRMNELREEEIRRIAIELHDTAGQMLATTLLAVDRAAREDAPQREASLAEARDLLLRTDQALRRLAHETRPPVLEDFGIGVALRLLCDGLASRSGIPIEARIEVAARPPSAIEIALYRIAQEALRNALKHASPSMVVVALRADRTTIALQVRDDGTGFEPGEARSGLGILGMRERVMTLDGTLDIRSRRGGGTELVVSIPREAPIAVPNSAGG
jgi:two-component system sensor histidine kinase UhpB